jgi:hypothetical protein
MAPTLSGHPPPEVVDGGTAGFELETAAALGDGGTRCTVRHFLELAGLGREARAFCLRDDNLPETGRAISSAWSRAGLPGAFIGIKNGALRQALVSPVIERARNEGLCSAAVQSTALQMRIRRKRVL